MGNYILQFDLVATCGHATAVIQQDSQVKMHHDLHPCKTAREPGFSWERQEASRPAAHQEQIMSIAILFRPRNYRLPGKKARVLCRGAFTLTGHRSTCYSHKRSNNPTCATSCPQRCASSVRQQAPS